LPGILFNIFGAPYELTNIDANSDRGATILDLDSLEYFFINNNVSIKHKTIIYPEIPDEKEIFNNKITVFMTVEENLDGNKVDKYIKQLEKFKPAYEIQIELFNNNAEIVELSKTPNIAIHEMFKQFLDANDEYINKTELYDLLINEYNNIIK
jgi:hypothetical protein